MLLLRGVGGMAQPLNNLSCLNITLFVCQKQAKGPTHVIAMDLDNHTVTFQTDRTPQDRIAVRF